MRITCSNCGGDHPKWECKRPATKSTAARKSERLDVGSDNANGPAARPPAGIVGSTPTSELAGCDALPVDTRPCTCHPDDNPPVPCAKKYALSECLAPSIQKPKRGRPPTGFDKAEYNRQFMRDKRARIKAEKEAGK